MVDAVAYLTNEHDFYVKMMLHSARMVREHNPDLPIHLFVVRNGLHQTIARENIFMPSHNGAGPSLRELCDVNGYVLHEEEPVAGDFFHANRALLAGVECDSLLYIDADTFVFGDLAPLFAKYSPFEFAACEARWVKGRNWRPGHHLPIDPISSGVMLFNGGLHRDWCHCLPGLIDAVRDRKYPVSEFVFEQHTDGLLREEFATNQWVANRQIMPRYFDQEDVHLILHEQDIQEVGKSTIFHCYTPNWRKVCTQLAGRKKISRKLFRPR